MTDVRQCDHPDYLRASGWEQPFGDLSFDVVLSLDVLEHLPGPERFGSWASSIAFRANGSSWAPRFPRPEIEEAETRLAQSLMGTRRFLQEHRDLGLPDLAAVRDFYLSKGYTVITFANGYLPSWLYWQVTTQHYFGLNDYEIARRYNALYSTASYPSDNREPAYRHILLIAKSALDPSIEEQLGRLSSISGAAHPIVEHLAFDPNFLDVHERAAALLEKRRKSLIDVQFLINERQKLIELLRRELQVPVWRRFCAG